MRRAASALALSVFRAGCPHLMLPATDSPSLVLAYFHGFEHAEEHFRAQGVRRLYGPSVQAA